MSRVHADSQNIPQGCTDGSHRQVGGLRGIGGGCIVCRRYSHPRPPSHPLVAKIAEEIAGRNLYHEAGMYRLLDSVQGTILARCYGYFRGSVDLRELDIKPWDPHAKFPRSEDMLDIFRPPNPYASLGILLLEKLGPPASTLKTVPIGMKEQFQEVVRTLVELDVIHESLYGRNVFTLRIRRAGKPRVLVVMEIRGSRTLLNGGSLTWGTTSLQTW
ncbi:hypothetical protein GY45DRAFT_1332098 [Cubamyces sp. BRFM 1775]|nr:hypothetical protein GY45DRAFT_1332098 [Cubamyces sp. BRFM 1775]